MDEPNIAQSGWSWHADSLGQRPTITFLSAQDLESVISQSAEPTTSRNVLFSWSAEATKIPVHCLDGLNFRALALSISFTPNQPRVNSYTFRVVDPPVLKKKSKTNVPNETSTNENAEVASPESEAIVPEAASPVSETASIVSDVDSAVCSTDGEVLEDLTSHLELPDVELDDESIAEHELESEAAALETQASILDDQVQVIEQIAEALNIDPLASSLSQSAGPNSTSIQSVGDETTQADIDILALSEDRISTKIASKNEVSASATQTVESPAATNSDGQTAPPPHEHTWVKAPADVVKLEDRLFYMLQPSLETLITEGDLHFPFHPFNYQFHGVAFLFPRLSAVLADEMGLGKTMQAITSIRLLIHASEVRSVLLVCPKPLVSNWVREFHQWAPEIPVAVIEGDTAKREWQWNQVDAPVKIANYEALIRDRDLATQPDRHFDLIVLDESQRIKNRNGTTAQVVRSLSRTRSWALTGTPVENSPEDLVGIFEFVAPGHLHKGMKPRALGQAAADYILRRTKDKVLTDMPPKMFRDAHLELSPEQHETYQMAENDGILRLSHMGASATIQHVFELVLRLKQDCNFDPATGESSKLERLEADMEEIAASGKKAILFSQWVDPLMKIKERLDRFGVMEYHGKIPHKQREGVIQQFKNDPDKHIILMSYGAGSVGLNLQFCEYVFLFDRWWNPAIEDQAINRAHRIGAAGPVTVTRFLTLNTIEERINQVLEEKRELFDTILSGASSHRSLGLSAEEIFGLFKLKSPAGPIRFAA